jgi:hypothetical protein
MRNNTVSKVIEIGRESLPPQREPAFSLKFTKDRSSFRRIDNHEARALTQID